MKADAFVLKPMRKIISHGKTREQLDTSRGELKDQEANDYVREQILDADQGQGLMVAKFGSIEFMNVCSYLEINSGSRASQIRDYLTGKKNYIFPDECLKMLVNNAGFFPESPVLWKKYVKLFLEDLKDIDILGSYIVDEEMVEDRLVSCKKTVNLDGYLAPFLWKHPWTSALENKKVLVIHPFTDSIKKQYERRETLFEDPLVLPEFKELICIKAVQSIAGNGPSTGFSDWFAALHSMEEQIDQVDFDVALIGCGAYGMELAAYCKRKGKIAIHMASWVQMLFGIYGNRWLNDQPEYRGFINPYWIRPMDSEKPENLDKVEKGAYW